VAEHRDQARRNANLAGSGQLTPDWEVTVWFYAALHWVRAFFRRKGLESHSHEDDRRNLEQTVAQGDIRFSYRWLRRLSEFCRYECYQPDQVFLEASKRCYERLESFFEPKSR
jgi:hypothetical protein